MLRVKALLFAGRPNPEWTISLDESREVLRAIADNREMIASRANYPWCVAYNGLEISLLSDTLATEFDLPPTFIIQAGKSRSEAKAQEIADRLVSHMLSGAPRWDSWIEGLGPNHDLQELVWQEVRAARPRVMPTTPTISRGLLSEPPQPFGDETLARGKCIFDFAAYNPGYWNDGGQVQLHNNCYCYATNRRIDKFGYPGKAAGQPVPTPWTVDNVTRAILADGARRFDDCQPDSQKDRWLFALVIAEFKPGDPRYNDFHFYRGVVRSATQFDQFWAHKPGQFPVMNTDCDGKTIINVERAARGKYHLFGGYFCGPKSMRIDGNAI